MQLPNSADRLCSPEGKTPLHVFEWVATPFVTHACTVRNQFQFAHELNANLSCS